MALVVTISSSGNFCPAAVTFRFSSASRVGLSRICTVPVTVSATLPLICTEKVAAMEFTRWVWSAARLMAVRGLSGLADLAAPVVSAATVAPAEHPATRARAPAPNATAARRRRPVALVRRYGANVSKPLMPAG